MIRGEAIWIARNWKRPIAAGPVEPQIYRIVWSRCFAGLKAMDCHFGRKNSRR